MASQKHKALIGEVRGALAKELSPEHDEIFILRYVLSYKTLDKVLTNIRGGLEYRKNNPYLQLAHKQEDYPLEQEVRKWTAADFHNTQLDGGPVHIIRAGLANVSGLYSSLSVKDIVEEMTLKKEECFLLCDAQTRKTGRLTKEIVIMDFANQGWFYPSQALIQSQNDASAISKLLYPQLLDKVIILNAPWFFKQLWKIATMVLSESLTSKVGMCGGTIVPGELGKCPWASKNLALEDMPTFVGGTCSCPGGCVGDVPNDCTTVKGSDIIEQEEEEYEEEEEEAADGSGKPAASGGWLSGWW